MVQLHNLVSFHKAMGDPTRIRIITLLSKNRLHGQAIAGKLGLTPPTISHHLAKLREVNLVYTRREKNTIYYYLNKKIIQEQANVLLQYLDKRQMGVEKMEEKQKILENFFTKDGRLKTIPAQRKKKLIVFESLVKRLEKGRKYSEKEINEFVQQFHEDYATIRREFIINQYMYRQNGIYELNPEELWAVK